MEILNIIGNLNFKLKWRMIFFLLKKCGDIIKELSMLQVVRMRYKNWQKNINGNITRIHISFV